MTRYLDLPALVHIIGPRFAEGADARDADDTFVDAHYDVRADTPRNSGTPYRQLLEEGIVAATRFYEMGSQPFFNSPVYARYLREKGAHIVPIGELLAGGVAAVFERILSETAA